MNHCYFCEVLLDRLPDDHKQRICDECKRDLPKEFHPVAPKPVSIASYWTRPPVEQSALRDAAKPVTEGLRCITIFDHPYLKEQQQHEGN